MRGRRAGSPERFLTGHHVDAVDAHAVGRVGKAHRQFARVILGLPDALRDFLRVGLGFHNGKLGVAVLEDVVRLERLSAPTASLDAAGSDGVLPPDAAAFDDSPARRLQSGVNQLGSRLGFVHVLLYPFISLRLQLLRG